MIWTKLVLLARNQGSLSDSFAKKEVFKFVYYLYFCFFDEGTASHLHILDDHQETTICQQITFL